MWYVAVTEPIKMIICGSFAECYTRQRPHLPSVSCKTLGKVDTRHHYVHSGLKNGMFAECQPFDTRQRSQILSILERALPSAHTVAHGKSSKFAECHYLTHGKLDSFAEGPQFDTRQKGNLCRVSDR